MGPSKILMVRSAFEWSLERIYLRYFKELGVDAKLFPAQNIFYADYNKSIFHKIIYRLGFKGVLDKINRALLDEVEAIKPDYVWVFKGMEIFPETIAEISGMGYRIVNYNPDNPFVFSSSGSGNKNVRKSIPFYTAHITYDRVVLQTLKDVFKGPSFLLPFGYETMTADPEVDQDEIVKVCFIGNGDPERALFLKRMAAELPVDVYGRGWEALQNEKNISIFPPVYGPAFPQTVRMYRVQLNLLREHNATSHNMRSFEIPGFGGIGLYPETTDHVDYFEQHHLATTYKNVHDCIEKARNLLLINSEEVKQRRQEISGLCHKLGYDYKSR